MALLITARNRQPLLDRALHSLQPELSLIDIILVDDGSDPPINTQHFSHYPIKLIRLPQPQGPMAASNAGLSYIYQAGYEFIARLDSDDVVINQRFSKQLAFLRANPDIGLVGSHFYIVTPEGRLLFHSQPPCEDTPIRNGLHVGNMLHHPTWMMRTDVAKKAGFYCPDFTAAGDTEFCWRIIKITRVANIPEPLIHYEMGGKESITRTKRFIQAWNTLRLKLRYFAPCNPYSYVGIVVSFLDITNLLPYMKPLKKPVMRLLFGAIAFRAANRSPKD